MPTINAPSLERARLIRMPLGAHWVPCLLVLVVEPKTGPLDRENISPCSGTLNLRRTTWLAHTFAHHTTCSQSFTITPRPSQNRALHFKLPPLRALVRETCMARPCPPTRRQKNVETRHPGGRDGLCYADGAIPGHSACGLMDLHVQYRVPMLTRHYQANLSPSSLVLLVH